MAGTRHDAAGASFPRSRASMGFTFSELQEIVERDERQMPILGLMTDLEFDVWDEAGRLLQKVAPAVL